MSGPGHNSSSGADQLRSIVQRVERLEDEKAEVVEQIREVLREAKNEGFDVKVLRVVLRRRKMKPHDRREMDDLLDLYETRIEGVDEARDAARSLDATLRKHGATAEAVNPDGEVVAKFGGRG